MTMRFIALPRRLLLAALACTALAAAAQPTAGLEAALLATLARHPALAGQQAQVAASAFGGDAARSQRYPSLSAQIQGSGNGAIDGGSATPASLRARQPLWAFGRIDSSIAAADAETAVQRGELQRLRRELLSQTAVAYAQVLGLRAREAVAQESVAAHGVLYEQIRRRERGQLASRADVGLAATRLAQARAATERIAGELEMAVGELLALTQVPVATDQPVPPRYTQLPEGERLLAMARENSAELVHRQLLVARARAAVEQARTSVMPTVYLQADKGRGLSGAGNEGRVSVVLEGALEGLGLAARGRTGAALAQVTAAEAELAAADNELGRNVRRLQSARRTQRQLLDVQQESLRDLDALLASYKRQYEAGTKSWLDVLNIQRELSEQKQQQAQAESDWLVQSLQLATLTGGFDAMAERAGN